MWLAISAVGQVVAVTLGEGVITGRNTACTQVVHAASAWQVVGRWFLCGWDVIAQACLLGESCAFAGYPARRSRGMLSLGSDATL